jgi:hypothetical protein
VSGFIAVEMSLLGQQFQEFSTGRPEGLARFAEQFGDVAAGNPDADDVLEKVPNPTTIAAAASNPPPPQGTPESSDPSFSMDRIMGRS